MLNQVVAREKLSREILHCHMHGLAVSNHREAVERSSPVGRLMQCRWIPVDRCAVGLPSGNLTAARIDLGSPPVGDPIPVEPVTLIGPGLVAVNAPRRTDTATEALPEPCESKGDSTVYRCNTGGVLSWLRAHEHCRANGGGPPFLPFGLGILSILSQARVGRTLTRTEGLPPCGDTWDVTTVHLGPE